MMKTPIGPLAHWAPGYDPAKAHAYYEQHKHLHPRQRHAQSHPSGHDQGHHAGPSKSRTEQKAKLQNLIGSLTTKLGNLEQLIQTKEAALQRDQATAKSNASKNAQGKGNKPKTAAEKAKIARDNKKYRDRHKSQLKAKAKQASGKSGGKSTSSKSGGSNHSKSIAELKALANKVRGQIAVAKQKLAAL